MLSRPVRSYPVRNVCEFIQQCYTDLVDSAGTSLPTVATLLGPDMFGPAAFIPDLPTGFVAFPGINRGSEEEVRRELDNVLFDNRAHPPSSPDPQRDFLQARMFHERRDPRRIDPDPRPLPLDPPDLDFHQAINAIGEYPAIMRELGLLRDLENPPQLGHPTGHHHGASFRGMEPAGIEYDECSQSRFGSESPDAHSVRRWTRAIFPRSPRRRSRHRRWRAAPRRRRQLRRASDRSGRRSDPAIRLRQQSGSQRDQSHRRHARDVLRS